MRLPIALLCAAPLVLSCVLDEPIEDTTNVESLAIDKGCQPLCGKNSPVVDGVHFWELHPTETNLSGVRIVSVQYVGGLDIGELRAYGGKLWGRKVIDGVPNYYQLTVGATISVEVDTGDGPPANFTLNITDMWRPNFWVGPSENNKATSYGIQYVAIDRGGETTFRHLCPEPDLSEEATQVFPANHFVVFSGDRYDAYEKTVATGAAAGQWINFACAGSAPQKLHLNRHTSASSTPPYVTSWQERQAMLKSYSAAYCPGSGKSYTHAGQPLTTVNHLGWQESLGPLGPLNNGNFGLVGVKGVEAVWDEKGALCLTTPRSVKRSEVACQKHLPRCRDWPGMDWQSEGTLLTGRPSGGLVITP